jgi:hypothetical protein
MRQQLSQVAFWNPTQRITLWHLGSVSATCLSCLFRFPKSQTRVVSVTMRKRLRYWLRRSRAKLLKQLKQNNGLVRRLQIFGQGAQLGNKYRFCMGMTDRPSRATNFDTIYYCLVLLEWKSIDVSRELPVKIVAPWARKTLKTSVSQGLY